MKLRATLIAAALLVAAPAFAGGEVVIVQTGPSNWAAVNQFTRDNASRISQVGTQGGYSNNYANFAQTGRTNFVYGEQTGTQNLLGATQFGRDSYVGAAQNGSINQILITQSRRLGR